MMIPAYTGNGTAAIVNLNRGVNIDFNPTIGWSRPYFFFRPLPLHRANLGAS
jgi:hypothetical protein